MCTRQKSLSDRQAFSNYLPLLLQPLLLCSLQGEVGNLRSNELLDLQSRMGAAMQRIAELEAALQRSHGTAGNRPAGNDDTRAVIRDNKFRRTPRISPHNSARSPGSDPSAFASNTSDNVKMRTRQVR
jgi:hypothetical protein